MNTEGQEMETYQIFVFPMGNTEIKQERELQARKDSVTTNNRKEKSRDDFDYEEAIKNSESKSDKVEEAKED